MLHIKRIISKILRSNVYIVSNGSEAVIIDAGAHFETIKPEIEGLKVKAILLTHCHFDHTLFLEDYVKELSCPVFMHEKCPKGLQNPLFNHKEDLSIKPNRHFVMLKPNQKITLLNTEILCVHTPGHSFTSMCYLFGKEFLFSGDTIFASAIGRFDLQDSSEDDVAESLKKLLNLQYAICFSGHSISCKKNQIDENIIHYLKTTSCK